MSRIWHHGWADDRRVQRGALVVAGALALVFLVQVLGKAYRPQGYDLTSYLHSARALAAGRSPYNTGATFPYIYPMFTAMALIPLAFAPYWLACVGWYAATVGALVWSMRLALGLHDASRSGADQRRLLPPLVLLALLFLTPIQNNLLNGQIDFVVLLLCLLFARAARDGRVLAAALFLGAAIATKLVPLIFVPFLLVRRRVGTLALALVAATLLAFAPVIFLGTAIVPIYRDYLSLLAAHGQATAVQADITYFNLDGAIRALAPALAALMGPALRPAAAAAVMLPLVLADLRLRRTGAVGDRWGTSLYLVAILLISPISETHHLAFLFPAVALVATPILLAPRDAHASHWVIAATTYALLVAARRDATGPWAFAGIALLYCAMLAHTFRLPVHGWSSDATSAPDLPTATGMA